MPYAPETKRYSTTGTSKAAEIDEAVDLFGFEALHQLGEVLEPLMVRPRSRGRRLGFPVTALLAVTACARICGSQAGALAMLRSEGSWERCRVAYERASGGVVLPMAPPTVEQIQWFRGALLGLPTKKRPIRANHLPVLQQRFQHLAYGQAFVLGNFRPGIAPELSCPEQRHAIYGDGTSIAPFTDVKKIIDPVTGQVHLFGSRAKSVASARIPRTFSNSALDGKSTRGLNMVSLHTWTRAGRVVLATGTALGAEQWSTLDLLDKLMAKIAQVEARTSPGSTQPGVHTLIYDRAITGWSVEYLMHTYGMQVLGKPTATSGETGPDSTDEEIDARTNRYAAERGLNTIKDAEVRKAMHRILRRDVLLDVVRYHEKLPLGLSIYPRQRTGGLGHGYDLIHSHTIELPPAVHDTSNGPCSHSLAVDDGSLFLIEPHPDEPFAVKTALLPCQSATRHRRPDGRWGTRSRYTVPCEHGAFTYERHWEPNEPRRQPPKPDQDDSKHKESRPDGPKDHVGWRLRPLSRPDDLIDWYNGDTDMDDVTNHRFTDLFSRRNDSETFNNWYQTRLPQHGRAASESARGQELDFLLGALVNNSITWTNHKRG